MSNKNQIDKFADKLEKSAEVLGEDIRDAAINWVKNDQVFNGFRNTYARWLITGMTWSALYGFGTWAFVKPELAGWYIVILILLTLMNQISVRFAFNVDHEKDLTDEYQMARRDAAYRRAYRKVSHQLMAGLILFWGVRFILDMQAGMDSWVTFPAPGQVEFNLHTNLDQIIVLSTFYISLFGLQKYMSWGFKGEPWQDSARKKA